MLLSTLLWLLSKLDWFLTNSFAENTCIDIWSLYFWSYILHGIYLDSLKNSPNGYMYICFLYFWLFTVSDKLPFRDLGENIAVFFSFVCLRPNHKLFFIYFHVFSGHCSIILVHVYNCLQLSHFRDITKCWKHLMCCVVFAFS